MKQNHWKANGTGGSNARPQLSVYNRADKGKIDYGFVAPNF